jgi:hypothetical protein
MRGKNTVTALGLIRIMIFFLILLTVGCRNPLSSESNDSKVRIINPGDHYVRVGLTHGASTDISYSFDRLQAETYFNVKPGTYTIHCKAMNQYDSWTEWYAVGSYTFEGGKRYSMSLTNPSNKIREWRVNVSKN